MADMIKVLLVDDKEDYCESLAGVARINDLQVVYALDWETGFDLLKKDYRIEFVILDGKGKIEADQEKERGNFVIRAMNDLNAWNHQQKKYIPFCVNTGFVDNFENLEGNVEIFEKNAKSRDKMFRYIREEVGKSEYRTAKLLFPEPFEVFDQGIIDNKFEYLLVEMIQCQQKKDYRKRNLNLQRDLLEAIYLGLSKGPMHYIPESLVPNNRPNLEYCTQFFESRPVGPERVRITKRIPGSIKGAFRKLKDSSSQYSHLNDEDTLEYAFLANFYLLMELLCWSPKFVNEHHENYN